MKNMFAIAAHTTASAAIASLLALGLLSPHSQPTTLYVPSQAAAQTVSYETVYAHAPGSIAIVISGNDDHLVESETVTSPEAAAILSQPASVADDAANDTAGVRVRIVVAKTVVDGPVA